MNRRRLRQQCPECGRAGGKHAGHCSRFDDEPEPKPTYQPPDPHAAAKAYFADMHKQSLT